MFRELSQSDFARVRPLFHALAFQPFCTAVLAGLHPGRIFVDDVETPQTACMIREDGWSFLAGEPNNTAFNQALHTAIWERAVIDEDTAVMLFTCEPPGVAHAPPGHLRTAQACFDAATALSLPATCQHTLEPSPTDRLGSKVCW